MTQIIAGLVGSRTTRIYCAPDCSAARRIAIQNRVAFRDAGEALAEGYRVCKLCLRGGRLVDEGSRTVAPA
ncbi:MAG: Methylphosphotriester-DNA-protein-cysteine methyltransferase [Chloroflexi bacterium]|jgi:methylphosphotriester-DNA--protein-cysteine methyltransferase|nr:MAG: Methylphosphotriester-DNA-protein-cysteine methyltransferase [Chloroflexota bacterium]